MGTDLERIPTKGLGRWQHRLYSATARRWRALALLPVVAGTALAVVSASMTKDCKNAHLALAFGIRPERVNELTVACSADTNLRAALIVDTAAALLYGIGLSAILLAWWRFGWRSGSQRTFTIARAVAWLPVGAGICDIIENVAGMWATPTDSGIDIPGAAAHVAATAGITKWLLVVASLFAVVLTLYGAWRFRALLLDEQPPKVAAIDPVRGAAVCLSGGGIRSASFAWGALTQLSQTGVFSQLRSMYSVSGGGYAATSWTASTGFDDPATFYSVVADPDRSAPPTTPFQHIRRNQRYLDSRPGGLSKALCITVLSIAVNLSVIYAGIVVAVTLPARLSGSRFGAVVSGPYAVDNGPAAGSIREGAWLPGLWLLALAVALVLASWVPRTKSARRSVLQAATASALTGAAIISITIVLPWVAHRQDDLWRASWWATLPAVVTWVFGIIAAVLRPRLSTIAIRLGGVLGAGFVLYVLLGIIRNAMVVDSNWSAIHGVEAGSPAAHWLLAMAIAIVWLVVIDHTGVQWWSMHPLYRDRLATTFSMQRSPSGEVVPLPDETWPRWSQLNTTAVRPGPEHVVCAATHRRERKVTGLRAVGYRFSRQGVGYFEPCLDGDTTVDIRAYTAGAAWLDQSFGLSPGSAAPRRRFRKPHARSTAMAGAAMSGAAFNSVMGRQSKGSTDSLLAMLNLRLGVWMPNQRFATHTAAQRKCRIRKLDGSRPRPFPRPGLRYLFHEVIGHYDLADPFIQVSDGGHWENLGLAEALRDRHRTIIAVDASGGKVEPASAGAAGSGFAALFEATDLARMELSTEIRIDVSPMRPDERTGRSLQNWAQGVIVYHRDRIHDWRDCEGDERCPVGTLLFVKAVICDRTPAEVLAYANTDRVFPDYSTADQFLTTDQFDALVRLGRSATADALAAYPVDTSAG